MVEIIIPLGALAWLAFLFVQLCRLISHATLNRTIRKALDADPASARLLIDKLEPRARTSAGLIGWTTLVGGVAIGAIGVVNPSEAPGDSGPIAVAGIVFGLGLLLYSWWVGRVATEPSQPTAQIDIAP